MAQAIVVTSGKGGVGKTTISANIGAGLAALGKSVVLIDADIGLRNLDVVTGLEDCIVYDLVDAAHGKCSLKQALLKHEKFGGVYIIPAAQMKDKDSINTGQMINLCEELKERFDFIIIDCPAGIEQGFRNAVAGADKAIVVVTPDLASVRDADRIAGLLEQSGIDESYLVINRIRRSLVKRGKMMSMDEIVDTLSIDLLGVIPDDEAVIAAAYSGQSIISSKKAPAGKAYMNISRRLTGESVPLMGYENGRRFLRRAKRPYSK